MSTFLSLDGLVRVDRMGTAETNVLYHLNKETPRLYSGVITSFTHVFHRMYNEIRLFLLLSKRCQKVSKKMSKRCQK
jgi:hypothetical protein